MSDADLSLDKLPEDLLERHETAMAHINGLPHGVDVYHLGIGWIGN